MGLRRWLLILLCVGASAGWAADTPEVPGQIRLASEAWNDYTNADGSGLAWDVLREVFEPAGVKVKIRSVPYTRSVGLARRGEVDAWVGSYHDETEGVLYARWNYDADHIYALASSPEPTLKTLGAYRLAWVRGYKYEEYLPNIHRFNQIERRGGILPMLQHGRADFYIDALAELKYILGQADDPAVFKLTHIAELPLFLGFTDNERGRALMALFDRRMESLVTSGELKPIFERWHQPYPF
ncbi:MULTISPECIES: substrate-binding periplasmic protein [unclassified Pseudomonas]|uniref:substrate-binding periplasmic protein n=1 Tax=unclassified Pseudomonas TaxID=196821 RepID=UPI001463E72C|nr:MULTISPECIES: transporter substrate-binding domain-containing protein [unclassified Pseudomonas]QJI19163.1 transporter substrate-binding domain-containing protein [Pseudomonas sp. ADAK21]QJI25679.1 transporter substrate-binding domain-containing protein [Pseudomonas sp. ADAK20]